MFKNFIFCVVSAVLMLFSFLPLAAQNKAYQGQVVDEERNPLAGVTINVDGTSRYVVSDTQGNFSLNAAEGETLVFSMLGYKTQKRVMNKITSGLLVKMESESIALDETVVVGYGSQTKRDLTGAVATVNASELLQQPVNNVFDALNGKIPGMQIIQTGEPGGAPEVRIRGMGSYGDASPICVVDGQFFEVDALSMINSSDIESITVLKDASATAIYGSRGANGVIIVTTKTGDGTAGATRVNVNAHVAVAEMERKLGLTNLSQYQQLMNMQHMADNWNNPAAAAQIPYPDWQNAGEGTDWQELVTRLAVTESADVSISGNTKSTTFYLSTSYLNQQGIVKESGYNRFTARMNVSYSPKKWFKVGLNSMFSYDNRTGADNRVLQYADRRKPDDPVYQLTPDGDESSEFSGGSSNPYALLYYTHDRYNKSWNYNNNLYVEFRFARNFTLRSSISNVTKMGEEKIFLPAFMENVENARDFTVSEFNHNTVQNRNWLQENILTYKLDRNRHNLTAMAGCTFQSIFNQYARLAATELPWEAWKNRNLWYVEQGKNITGTDGGSEKTYASFFARVVYSYKSRYTLTATGRFDGSSAYPEDNRWGFFPSVGVAWIASQEKFMRNADWLELLKLRASWGVVGNDKGVTAAQTLYAEPSDVVMGPDNGTIVSNALKLMYDNTLTWERAATFNAGIDFSLFRNVLKGSVDLYHKTTSNVMMPLNIQPSNISVTSNIGTVLNRGFEVSLTVEPKTRAVKTSFTVTASTNYNEVLKIAERVGSIDNTPNRTLEGYPIGGFWTYETIGVFQNEAQLEELPHTSGTRVGDLIFKDVNGDGYIDSNDYVYQGSYLPKANFGLAANVEWKGLGLSVDLTSGIGAKSFNERFRGRQPYFNGLVQMLDGWTGEGTTNVHPRYFGLSDSSALPSDYFIENCNYLSIYNAQIYYNLPRRLCQKIKMKSLRVYVNGRNLYTFTAATGYSPEIPPRANNANSGGVDRYGLYPRQRTFTFGFSIGF